MSTLKRASRNTFLNKGGTIKLVPKSAGMRANIKPRLVAARGMLENAAFTVAKKEGLFFFAAAWTLCASAVASANSAV